MTTPTTIKDYISIDKKYCYTPDQATLRFSNTPVTIFLWDDNTEDQNLRDILNLPAGGALNNQFRVKFTGAVTVDKYLPWYNIGTRPHSYVSYCLEDVDDVEWLDVEEYSKGEPLRLKGTVIQTTLKNLLELDLHYANTKRFDRVEISVQPSVFGGSPIRCWAYMNTLEDISEYDEDTRDYVLDDGIDLTPFPTKKVKNEDIYTYGGNS